MYIHLLTIIFDFGCTFILQRVKELKHFGTIAAPAELQLGCKENTSLASFIIPDLDLTVLLITFMIGLIYSKCVFILYESNFQSNFRRAVFSVEYSAAVEMGIICRKLDWRSKHSQDYVYFQIGFTELTFPWRAKGKKGVQDAVQRRNLLLFAMNHFLQDSLFLLQLSR